MIIFELKVKTFEMKKAVKSILLISILIGQIPYTFADRGVRSKSKRNISLNVCTSTNFNKSLDLNLKTGLKFKGIEFVEYSNYTNFISGLSVKTYEKGNTTYLIPVQKKIIIPEVKQGYTGMKLKLKP